ncbi:aminophospholipid translocase regulatory protein CDC50 [Vanrija pseudolonga]|uniref:Meiotically up-regulated gene 89 protein n=1 Tax=Vanrija pseudolonga TaxID=143232 RepID=A0AAF1BI73_9TREE|nr:Meiotically up-regulated gene 89 protein [Vanrija pseudolonga]
MGLFNRKNKKPAEDVPVDADQPNKEKVKWSKRPANTAFKQQRLKAWQPILTPKAVLPTLFLIGVIFAPIGALIIWGSGKVTTITLDYTQCDEQAPTNGTWADMPKSAYGYDLKSGSPIKSSAIAAPQWTFSNDSTRPYDQQAQCRIRFNVPYDLGRGVFLYYKLTNYYQNHRRYVQSFDSGQLLGNKRSTHDINKGNCKPITSKDDKQYYPCGLIANSLFNDTFPSVVLLNAPNGANNQTYEFSEKNIAWHGISKNYKNEPNNELTYENTLPPPNWAKKYPDGYTNATGWPKLADDEHFQIWMRVAALPTFRKLWGRNDNDVMLQGNYEVLANMNYPVKMFSGTKSIVISTVAWVGGKQPFLGWAYVAGAILCVALALAGLLRHLIKPRKMGDMSLLSWNQPQAQATR